MSTKRGDLGANCQDSSSRRPSTMMGPAARMQV